MALCDYAVDSFVRSVHWDELNRLPAARRAVKKFRLALNYFRLDVKADDLIAGWFVFEGQGCPRRAFDDEGIAEEERSVMEDIARYGSRTSVDKGHTLIDYNEVLTKGLKSYEQRIDAALKEKPDHEYLLAMRESIAVVRAFMRRLADELDQRAAQASPDDRPRLWAMRDMVSHVPYEPARSFREAVQSVWLMHFLVPLAENSWASISLGRFDHFMEPFYRQAKASGESKDSLLALLHNFYRLLNSYCDGACLLNVGPDYNELSRLLIDCQKEFALPAPILGARVTEDTSDEIWDQLIDEKLFSMGQPTFYGEASCLAALREKGVPEDKAKGFSNNSCMGIALPGHEYDSMWGCVFVVPAAVAAALCQGALVSRPASVPGIGEARHIDQVFDNFERCAAHILASGVRSYEARARYSERTVPDPFVSLLTRGCIERRSDFISGAEYHCVTIECMGMINAADALCAVDKLVFESGRYTLAQLTQALRDNFEGHEALRRDVLACPKFGRDEEDVPYAVRIAEILQRLIRAYDHDNLHYAPSLHTIDTNVGYGASWGAGYDGRLAGEPFAKNAGPSNEARSSDPTAMVLAASALPQAAFYGGQPLDVNFQLSTVREHKREIRALIEVYLQRGALQFQVNALSAPLLRQAFENPQLYPGLVVRIGGYSAYFRTLSRSTQLEFIERIEKESASR